MVCVPHVECRRHLRAGMLFMSTSRVAGGGVIGRRWHSLPFGLSTSIVSGVIMSTYYRWSSVWQQTCKVNVHGWMTQSVTLSSHRSVSFAITFRNLNSIQLVLTHFNPVSLFIYFNTVLTVTWSWLYWYPTTTLSDPKIRQEESWLEQCCCVCRVKVSSAVLCTRYPKSVGWHTLKISCPCPRLCMSAPQSPIHHIALAGAETLDKAVGTCVSTLPNRPAPTAVAFKIFGNQTMIVYDFVPSF